VSLLRFPGNGGQIVTPHEHAMAVDLARQARGQGDLIVACQRLQQQAEKLLEDRLWLMRLLWTIVHQYHEGHLEVKPANLPMRDADRLIVNGTLESPAIVIEAKVEGGGTDTAS